MRKIHWGVLGTAGIAKGQTIPGMLEAENCHLYAIAGRSMEKAQAFQREFGFEKVYDSYDALLADPQVEAVYIPFPMNCTANGQPLPFGPVSMCCAKSLWHPPRQKQSSCLILPGKRACF